MMAIRKMEKSDLVWLKPIAEKYNAWGRVKGMMTDDSIVSAMTVAPYALGVIWHDVHGAVLQGLCDDYGIKQLIRLGDEMCKMADFAEIDLHTHNFNELPWHPRVYTRFGFEEAAPEIGHIRYVIKAAVEQEGA